MDILQTISSIVIPRWVKLTIAGTLFCLLMANLLVGYFGIMGENGRENWIQAAVYLLGVLLPILLIGLVALYSDSGSSALRIRSFEYMSQTVPESLRSIVEVPGKYHPYEKKKRKKLVSSVKIRVNQYKDSCIGRYLIEFTDRAADALEIAASYTPASDNDGKPQPRAAAFTLELNVRKANVVLFIPALDAAHLAGVELKEEEIQISNALSHFGFEHLKQIFPHTIEGAISEGYGFNNQVSFQRLGDVCFIGIVMIRQLDPKFLFQPQEKLYFAQDLMFMLKAFYNEQPALFARHHLKYMLSK